MPKDRKKLCACYVNAEEREYLEAAAQASRMTLSQFVARAALRAAGYEFPALRRAPIERKDKE